MEQNPQILHISYRENPSDSEYRWLKVNIVFRVFDEHEKIRCDLDSSDYVKTYLYEVENPEKITLHFAHTEMEWLETEGKGDLLQLKAFVTDPEHDISHLKRGGWQINPHQFLRKIEKFNVYRYNDYIEDNPVTRGALELLENLKENGSNGSRFVSFSTLIRSLMALDLFWD